jgi:hypothetical protein
MRVRRPNRATASMYASNKLRCAGAALSKFCMVTLTGYEVAMSAGSSQILQTFYKQMAADAF